MLAALLILAASLAAYHNSFSVPLLFDDGPTIADNPSIRILWPPGSVLSPPANVFSAGRPLLNLSFALNYAFGGPAVFGYHVGNLLILVLAGCTLFGVVRRTLLLPKLRGNFAGTEWQLALAVALLWTLHPLQTESVTYISQRAEALMGLCALLTLYGFIRSATSSAPDGWVVAAIGACFLGMASKEVMVATPLLVWLFDRTFVSGTFGAALRQHWRLYAGLAASWLFLGYLITTSNLAARDVGFRGGYTWWSYALTEIPVILRYLKLAVWPRGLVFDYGAEMPLPDAGTLVFGGLALAALLGGTVVALVRRPMLGFFGGWFFLFLAPTSSFVPVQAQPMAESRLYLPLAAVVCLLVFAVATRGRRALVGLWVLAAVCAGLTVRRNDDYRTELSIWSDTVDQRPGSSRAHNTHGVALLAVGKLREAAAEFEWALRIKPDFANAHYNLGTALSGVDGNSRAAIAQYEEALRLRPGYAEAHNNLAVLLAKDPARASEAIGHYQQALQIKPDFAEAHNNLAGLLGQTPGRIPEAMLHYEQALKARPDFAEAHYNLANLMAEYPARSAERISHYEQALRINPNLADAHTNLGTILSEIPGREPDAVRHFEAALRIQPNSAEAHFNLATTLLRLSGHEREAVAHFQAALRLRPDLDAARQMLKQLGAPPAVQP